MLSRKKNRLASDVDSPAAKTNQPLKLDSNRRFLMIMFLVIAIGGGALAIALRPGTTVPVYKFEIKARYPHDSSAFTQGLWIDPKDGLVYESTGQYGFSTIRKVELESGKVIKSVRLAPDEFGEGLTSVNGELVQLTYKEEKALVWSKDLVRSDKEFEYAGEGWGLTFDGQNLVMSNGTGRLSFRDPATFEEVRRLDVTRGGRFVNQLNELEYYGGKIYANRWTTDTIFEIDPSSGKVVAEIDLSGLWPLNERPRDGVLNGIAVNPKTDQMVVTGKYCPEMFELKLNPTD